MLNNHLSPQGQFYHYQYASDAACTYIYPNASPTTPPQADFDSSVHQYSPDSSSPDSFPSSPLSEGHVSLPSTPIKKTATRLRSGNRVPRPRNAFMIFRSEFWAEAKISKTVEHDHRHISRIIGHCWNQLTEEEKTVWRRRAEQEKIEHGIKYPGYRFTPNVRTKQVIKRKVKRNGEDEMLRCKKVAELLLAGKAGKELDHAVKSIDQSLGRQSPTSETNQALGAISNQPEHPVFRSPPLTPGKPKATVQPHQYPTMISSPQSYQDHHTDSYGQKWSLPYPTSHQSSYPVQQYISGTQDIVVSSSSQGYDNTSYYSQPVHYHGSHSVDSNHVYPRSSAFHIEYTPPFDFHGRNELPQYPSIAPNSWIPPRHGH
ncbi:hypothetical protein C0991_011267 [Blastosporella zonata]|nr:hypothetical protein C0991_011267 [Blastosporella zonata]